MEYFREIAELFRKVEITDKNAKRVAWDTAINRAIAAITSRTKKGGKVMFVGNGGSASIASHMAVDFLKNGNMPALAFNDSSFLTCIGNDLGYEYVFQKPIEVLAGRKDVLFAVSSSGRSKNILNAAKEAKKKGCLVITLSGFKQDNPLRKMGEINFYVPSGSYGFVEITHLAICHCIIDKIICDAA